MLGNCKSCVTCQNCFSCQGTCYTCEVSYGGETETWNANVQTGKIVEEEVSYDSEAEMLYDVLQRIAVALERNNILLERLVSQRQPVKRPQQQRGGQQGGKRRIKVKLKSVEDEYRTVPIDKLKKIRDRHITLK